MSEKTRPLVVTLEQTCLAVPAQWEGHLEDGRMFYVRFRNGRFTIRLSANVTDDVMDAVAAPPALEWNSDDRWDGWMEEGSMIDLAAAVLDFSAVQSTPDSRARSTDS